MMDTVQYWNRRYRQGGDSGAGSRGKAADAKAAYLNPLIKQMDSVADWGCGDGEVLSRLKLGNTRYLGIDFSAEAIRMCLNRFPFGDFLRMDTRENNLAYIEVDMAMSLDVVFHFPRRNHLIEYLDKVFNSARRMVVFHATDHDADQHGHHLRYREFTPLVRSRYPEWELTDRPEHVDRPGFWRYER